MFMLAAPFAAALAVLASCSAEPAPSPPATTRTLTVLSPHSDQIRASFGAAFARWHREVHNTEVEIDWIARGTPRCVKYVEDCYLLPREVAPSRRPDVLFGGGVGDHRYLAERGRCVPLQLDLPAERIPSNVGGIPMRDDKGRWYATGLTSFGILYNKADCEGRGIEPPSTWADLADPRFQGWLAVAGPDVSGTSRQCLMLVAHQHGWDKGWDIITRILANARTLVSQSSIALGQVESGESLATFSTNFDGQARAVASDGRLEYIDPPNGTALMPDIISVIECGRERELARRFVTFCLSPAGQALWGVREECRRSYAPTLYYYPLDRTLYAERGDDLAVANNPIANPVGQHLDPVRSEALAATVVPLVQAACGDNHLLLQAGWEKIIDKGMPDDALTDLTAPPFDEATAIDMGRRYSAVDRLTAAMLLEEWSQVFNEKYENVLQCLNADATAALNPPPPRPRG
jgi:ABC-type Fe3+ transport system substrate-binding protein